MNLHRLRKDVLVWMATHTCKAHRHAYITHPTCYEKEQPRGKEKLAFVDIEASNLDADFGMILSWCVKADGGIIHSDVLTLADINEFKVGYEDYRVVASLIGTLSMFDRIVTHYGNDFRYDIPFIRTRSVAMGLPFPAYGSIKHSDTYPILKKKFKLSRNRQEVAVRALLGSTEKNHIDGAIWRAASRGDAKSLAYILDHNKRDVRDLEKLYHKIVGFVKGSEVSI